MLADVDEQAIPHATAEDTVGVDITDVADGDGAKDWDAAHLQVQELPGAGLAVLQTGGEGRLHHHDVVATAVDVVLAGAAVEPEGVVGILAAAEVGIAPVVDGGKVIEVRGLEDAAGAADGLTPGDIDVGVVGGQGGSHDHRSEVVDVEREGAAEVVAVVATSAAEGDGAADNGVIVDDVETEVTIAVVCLDGDEPVEGG